MIKKIVVILSASLLLSGCGLNDPIYTPTGKGWKKEEFLGHKIYSGYIFTDCSIYNRETRLTYFANNKIMYIPALGQFSVYDKTSSFGTPIDSPQMNITMESTGNYVFSGDKGAFHFQITGDSLGNLTEFTVAHRPSNRFMIYQCGRKNGIDARIVSELFMQYTDETS
ncbi:hypothetical protein MLE32_000581 [Klebsiella aerogenes]|nr:hypothetical protein [Klebsiella aerogenes]